MKIHNCKQGSPEWFECRKSKLTGSNAQAIAASGKGLETYVNSLMAETYSSAEKEHYENDDIKRGKELEAQARALYELEKGVNVEEVGFIELDDYTGCSPDGLIGDDGVLEIKCPKDDVYFRLLVSGELDSKYVWQCKMILHITGRKWTDLVYYNPNFKKNMIITRIELDEDSKNKIESGAAKGIELIKAIEEKISKIYGSNN